MLTRKLLKKNGAKKIFFLVLAIFLGVCLFLFLYYSYFYAQSSRASSRRNKISMGAWSIGPEELVYDSTIDAVPDYPYLIFSGNNANYGVLSFQRGYFVEGDPFAPRITSVEPAQGLSPTKDHDKKAVLLSAVYKDSTGILHGFYHSEPADNNGKASMLNWSTSYIKSLDGGRTWIKPSEYVDNRVLTGFGQNGGADPYSILEVGDYLYQYYFEHTSGTHVDLRGAALARSLKSSNGVPGSWYKYYCNGAACDFTEPGIGGRFTKINFDGQMSVSYNDYLESYLAIDALPAWRENKLVFKISSDGIEWKNYATIPLPSPVPYPCKTESICKPGSTIHQDNKWRYAYMSLIASQKDLDMQKTSKNFYLYYVKVNMNTRKRYLMRRNINLANDPSDNFISVYELYDSTKKDHLYSTQDSEIQQAQMNGYVVTGSCCNVLSIELNGSVPLFQVEHDSDHFMSTRSDQIEYALSKGYRNKKLIGYCYTENTKPSASKPLYRFYSPTSSDHFYSVNNNPPDTISGWQYEGIECYVPTKK